jgi:hypothetical protein
LGPLFESEALDQRRVRDAIEHTQTTPHHLVDDLLVVHQTMLRPSGMKVNAPTTRVLTAQDTSLLACVCVAGSGMVLGYAIARLAGLLQSQ